MSTPLPIDGRQRAVIDAVLPCVDGGRFAAKSIAGAAVQIEAHCFTDGHDRLRAVLRWGLCGRSDDHELEMSDQGNDVWRAEITPPLPGRYRYTVIAWVDALRSWSHDLRRRTDLDDMRTALQTGATLIEAAATRAATARDSDGALASDAALLTDWAQQLRAAATQTQTQLDTLQRLALDPARIAIAERHADRALASSTTLELIVDRARAGFSSWYELFPRSAGEPGAHGTLRDVAARLPYIAQLGFDVLYLPPIHPIGRDHRKGRNNALTAGPDDVGSPWAIGASEGGHKSVLPQLGTPQDFAALLARARELGVEIALDLAFQCAPDHPYVQAHPQWFRHRPDGSVQYAENPPKKYQDIYPFDFETADWRALWTELHSVVEYWIAHGVTMFRVDNPHTKAFGFWEWLIGTVKTAHPDVVFLAEAFTRPKIMHRLAKLGFSQSYTYFTWRNSKAALTEYFSELSSAPARHYFRANLWPNTPDILHETLQSGLRPVFIARLVLAATLAANYGIYGPAFELMESTPREPGSEEYLDSEKYQLRHWQLDRPDSLAPLIGRLNRIRRDNPALQSDTTLRFCRIDNEQLLAFSKSDPDSGNVVVTIVNLDPHNVQSGWLELDDSVANFDAERAFQAHDLLSDQRFLWQGRRHFVALDPQRLPAHVFRLRRHMRTERDFDYFL